MQKSEPAPARPAAAVVLLRERPGASAAVFLVHRHAGMAFMPEVYVFPGGSVQPADRAIEETLSASLPATAGATALGQGFRAAALRECFEEAGVLLARRGDAPLGLGPHEVTRFAAYRQALNDRTITLQEIAQREGLTLALDELHHWAHWITPEFYPRRFDTHFFIAAMPHEQEAVHDQLENTDSLWITPQDALLRAQRGELPVVDPTIRQLTALVGLDSLDAARQRFAAPPRTILPWVEIVDGAEIIHHPDDP